MSTKHPVSAQETKKMLTDCFNIAIELGMLKKSQITNGVVRVSNRDARSYGGCRRVNGEKCVYVSLNIGGSVMTPDNQRMKEILHRNIHVAKRNTQRVRNYRQILDAFVKGMYVFNEYASVAEDPYIGTMASHDPKDCMKALVAHEVAHAVNYCTDKPEYVGRNHKNGWKKVYRILRVKLLAKEEKPVTKILETVAKKAAPTEKRVRRKKGMQDRMITFLDATQPTSRKEALNMARENNWSENTMSMVWHKWKNS